LCTLELRQLEFYSWQFALVDVRKKLALWSSRLEVVHEANNIIIDNTKEVTETATTQENPSWRETMTDVIYRCH
jgi:hypothetical protein